MEKPKIAIFTDGACSPNPGPGGWACILVGKHRRTGADHAVAYSGFLPDTTNNRAELMAAIVAFEKIHGKGPYEIDVWSDSRLLCKGMNEWVKPWQRRRWRKSNGRLVKNVDLWQRLLEICAHHTVRWHWVKAHSDEGTEQSYYNDLADTMARAEVEKGALDG